MRKRGFSLIEVMIALSVMLIGSVGALGGVLSANKALREGQLRLHKQVLIDATLQRTRLHKKELMYKTAIAIGSAPAMPSAQALGTGNWTLDPTPVVGGDLSTGSLFLALPDGTISPCTAATTPACVAGIVTCADAAIPIAVFCREVVTTQTAATFAPGTIVPAGSFVLTRWVRVMQKRPLLEDTLSGAVTGREVYAQ